MAIDKIIDQVTRSNSRVSRPCMELIKRRPDPTKHPGLPLKLPKPRFNSSGHPLAFFTEKGNPVYRDPDGNFYNRFGFRLGSDGKNFYQEDSPEVY